jgi:hypothetical protein
MSDLNRTDERLTADDVNEWMIRVAPPLVLPWYGPTPQEEPFLSGNAILA